MAPWPKARVSRWASLPSPPMTSKPPPPASPERAEASCAASSPESRAADAPKRTCDSTSSVGRAGVDEQCDFRLGGGARDLDHGGQAGVLTGGGQVQANSVGASSRGGRDRGRRTRNACRQSRNRHERFGRFPRGPARRSCRSTWASSDSSTLRPLPLTKRPRGAVKATSRRHRRRRATPGPAPGAGRSLGAANLDNVHGDDAVGDGRIGRNQGVVDGQRPGQARPGRRRRD